MKSEMQVIKAIADLGIQEQVPHPVEGPPMAGTPDDVLVPTPDDQGRIYVRLGVPLHMVVDNLQDFIEMRGDWEKMNWGPYFAVAQGLRKLIAAKLSVKADELVLSKLVRLLITTNQVMQYVEIVVPKKHEVLFTSIDTKSSVDLYLRTVEGVPWQSGSEGVVGQPDGGNMEAGDRPPEVKYAYEVRTATGGKTLPAACVIESLGWGVPLKLSGRIADKPDEGPFVPKEFNMNCRIDGYITSKRVVYLVPLPPSEAEPGCAHSPGTKIVTFDEALWFTKIAALAAIPDQTVRATYLIADSKERLTLVNLAQFPATGTPPSTEKFQPEAR